MRQRYAAFLSYSHIDRAAARRLQAWLEAYRVPEALVGTAGIHGPVLPRIRPVFRDEEDMGASGDLTDSVVGALAQSDALIVLCSPSAARSKWVAEEVRRFKARAGSSRVFAITIAGTPWATDRGVDATEECLPLPLRRHVEADGVVTEERAEPLVADSTGPGGWHAARMRLAAGLLGVPLDALVHREHGRRTRRLLGVAAILALALALTGALAMTAIRARDAARAERAEAERLVGFMLGDLRGRLDKLGRLDLMDSVATQTLGYYERQAPGELGAESLAHRAKALRLLGELRLARGDLDAAQRAFGEAARTTGELALRAPDDAERLFDHAQSEFWLGALAFERGNTAAARPHLEGYARLADRLVALDPERAQWRAEVAHARVNLGGLALADRDAAAAAALFRQAAATFGSVRKQDPSAAGAIDHARALAWLADANRLGGDLASARSARAEELAIHTELLAEDPGNTSAIAGMAWAHHALGDIALDAGDATNAVGHAREAFALAQRLIEIEPQNRAWSNASVLIERQLGMSLAAQGEHAAAERMLDAAVERARTARDLDPASRSSGRLLGSTLVARAELALAAGNPDLAKDFARQAAQVMPPPEPGAGDSLAWWARLHLALGDRAPAAVANILLARPGTRSLAEDCLVVAALGPASARAAPSAVRLGVAGFSNPRCPPKRRAASL